MKLSISLPAKEIFKNKSKNTLSGALAKIAISFFGKIFGTKILLETPEELQNIDVEMFKIIEMAEKLQKMGVINEIRRNKKHPDEPFIHSCFFVSPCPSASGGGSDFFNEKIALQKAISETVERHLWYNENFFIPSIINAPYKEVKSRALNILKMSGFSEKQKELAPILQFDENSIFGWLPANKIDSPGKILCPAQLISKKYFRTNVKTPSDQTGKENMLRWSVTTGLATSNFLNEAILKGALEIIERDAFIITYLNKLSPSQIDWRDLSTQDDDLDAIFRLFNRYNLEIHILDLATDFSVHAISAIIIDRSEVGPAFSIGNSAGFDLKETILKALSEALTIRHISKEETENEEKTESEKPCQMGKAERRRYWYNIQRLPEIEFLLKGPITKASLNKNFYQFDEKNKRAGINNNLKILAQELKTKKMEACYFELSNYKIRGLGFRSVQVIIPELQPLHLNETIPYFGGKRLHELPVKLGYQAAKEGNLNVIPHPFC